MMIEFCPLILILKIYECNVNMNICFLEYGNPEKSVAFISSKVLFIAYKKGGKYVG